MIEEAYYTPNILKIANNEFRACDSCQRNKVYTQNTFANTRATTPTHRGELLSIDYISPFPTGRGGVKQALLMINTFTKLVTIYAVKRATRHEKTIWKLYTHEWRSRTGTSGQRVPIQITSMVQRAQGGGNYPGYVHDPTSKGEHGRKDKQGEGQFLRTLLKGKQSRQTG